MERREYIVAHPSAQDDRLRLVKRPVDAEVDSALAILFLSLGERGETARQQGPHIAVVVLGDTVEFVRHEREGDVVGSIESAQGLEKCASEARMARRISRERRRKVRSGQVAGWRAQGRPGRVSDRVRIAIAGASGTGSRIGLANAGDRTPDIVVV